MSMMKERWMEIAFRPRRKVRFQFPIQATDETMAARVEEVLKLPSVSISAGGALRHGRRVIASIDGKQPEAGDIFDVTGAEHPGSPAAYEIKNGRIETALNGSPFEVTVYKDGAKYLPARSGEFGFAKL